MQDNADNGEDHEEYQDSFDSGEVPFLLLGRFYESVVLVDDAGELAVWGRVFFLDGGDFAVDLEVGVTLRVIQNITFGGE